MSIDGVPGGSSALQRQQLAFDRADERVASLPRETPPSGVRRENVGATTDDPRLADPAVRQLVTHRLLAAALQLAEVANEGIMQSLRAGGYDEGAAR